MGCLIVCSAVTLLLYGWLSFVGLGVGVAYGSVALSSVVRASIVGLALITSGCGFFLPANGPNSVGVLTGTAARVPYVVLPLTRKVIEVLSNYEPAGLSGMFSSGKPPPSILFNIGDVVTVTIFEAAAGGLFIPIEAGVRPGNFVTLPNQVVDNDGNISVPYAGLVRAAGRTNVQIQNDIVDKIKNRAIEPQVVVAMATQNTQLISVFGEVHTSIRYPAAGLGARDRITDSITRAGGISSPGYASWVMLERGGKRGTVPFARIWSMSRPTISSCNRAIGFTSIRRIRNLPRLVHPASRANSFSAHGASIWRVRLRKPEDLWTRRPIPRRYSSIETSRVTSPNSLAPTCLGLKAISFR